MLMSSTTRVTDTELRILDRLWDKPEQAIRPICEAIYGEISTSNYATVQSLLERLEKKGWVSRERHGNKHHYTAARSRSDFIGSQIQDVADAVCDGSVAALLGQLARSDSLTAEDRKQLRSLIKEGKG